MTSRKLILSIFTLIFITAACSDEIVGPEVNGELPRSLTTAEKKLLEADQSFSFELFKQVNAEEKEEENLFISPLSISMALGMTLNGAKGETYDEMRETLAFHDLSLEEINSSYQTLMELLTTVDPKVKMKIANSVWNKEGFQAKEEFKQSLQEYFEAEIQELDFSDPKAPEVINTWVKENTNGLIDSIIKGQIPPSIVMYLINAIYFKGDWTYQFDKEETREEPFYLETGEQVLTQLMNQKNDLPFYFSDEVQMIDLPYGDSLFSMTIMMPADHETSIDEFINEKLNQQNFTAWISQLSSETVLLKLPKFEMEYKIVLNDVLRSMGMKTAFSAGAANLAGIANAPLYISEVMHKSFITVDEVGTEAAAVTSVAVGITSAPSYPTMYINRPFVFVIREQNSSAILFMGKVKNPLED